LTYKKSPKYRLFGVIHKLTFIFEQPLKAVVKKNDFKTTKRNHPQLS